MKKGRRKKHHYLPINYLKGFTDSNNCFFVYDKQADRIIPSPIIPDAVFFENELNTVVLPDRNKVDFLEDIYTNTDNSFWGPLDRIRKSDIKTPIEILDRMHLFLFLSILHWRLPSNIGAAEKLSSKAFLENNEFDYFRLRSRNGEKIPEETVELVRSSPAFRKSFRLSIPFAPFFKDREWSIKLEKWRFIQTGDGNSWYIVGDNPIVTEGRYGHDPINCLNEFAFPVSGRMLLVSTSKAVSSVLSSGFVIQFNVSTIQRARRFVACQNRDFLEALIQFYKGLVRSEATNTIIPEMFGMLEEEFTEEGNG